MAVRLEAVAERRPETTQTLEHARPEEPGRPVLGWFLVAMAAVTAVGLWFSFGIAGDLPAMLQAYWSMI